MNDYRTDNWAGRRDPNTDPRNYHFPRSAKEAGFHYVPESRQEKDLSGWVLSIILVVVFIGAVILENLHWLA
jgi:hypothetical protein